MKIIIAPSKTKQLSTSNLLKQKFPLFTEKTNKINNILKKYTKSDLLKIMKIKGTMLDKVYSDIQSFNTNKQGQAFFSFNGLVFKGLDKTRYKTTQYKYIEENIIILDALYGIIEPGTMIKDYRLDFLMKIEINLYDFWNIEQYFKDEVIINLASNEFSKMIKSKQMINISFLQNNDNKFINLATYSKQARGKILNYMILNKINNINDIKKFNEDNYQYNETLSNEYNIVFTR